MGAGKQVWQVLGTCIRTAWVYCSRFLGRLFFLGFEPFLPLGYPRHFADDEAGRRPLTPLLPPHQGLPTPVKRLEMGDVFIGLLPMLNTAGLINVTGCKLCLSIVQALVKTPSTSWTRLLVESNASSPGTNITCQFDEYWRPDIEPGLAGCCMPSDSPEKCAIHRDCIFYRVFSQKFC